jgi:hypothetical protein
MATLHAYYYEHIIMNLNHLSLPQQQRQKCLLVFLNIVTRSRQRAYPQPLRQKCRVLILLRDITKV